MKNEKLELGNGVKRGNRVFGSKNSGASEVYSGTTKKIRSSPFASNLAPPFPIPYSLFPILIYLLFASCNLFKPADDDFFKKIDAEIAYAKGAENGARHHFGFFEEEVHTEGHGDEKFRANFESFASFFAPLRLCERNLRIILYESGMRSGCLSPHIYFSLAYFALK